MFTGIIEDIAKVKSVQGKRMVLEVPFSKELILGQSVACDGVCLTVVEQDEKSFVVEVLEETKKVTSLKSWEPGFFVNVERAMKASDRFDGHIVQAHVEGVGTLLKKQFEEGQDEEEGRRTWLLTVEVPGYLMKYMIYKGIIILNGIALTIVEKNTDNSTLQVAIIPHTWENTNLQYLQQGAQINVETDVLAKYVENMVSL